MPTKKATSNQLSALHRAANSSLLCSRWWERIEDGILRVEDHGKPREGIYSIVIGTYSEERKRQLEQKSQAIYEKAHKEGYGVVDVGGLPNGNVLVLPDNYAVFHLVMTGERVRGYVLEIKEDGKADYSNNDLTALLSAVAQDNLIRKRGRSKMTGQEYSSSDASHTSEELVDITERHYHSGVLATLLSLTNDRNVRGRPITPSEAETLTKTLEKITSDELFWDD